MGAFDGHLAADVRTLRLGLGQQQAAGHGNFEIGAKFGPEPLPHLNGFQQQTDGGRIGPCPTLALGHERFMGNLGMQAAGVRARGLGVEIEALNHQYFSTLASQVIGRGRTGEATAHDQDVAMHRAGGRVVCIRLVP